MSGMHPRQVAILEAITGFAARHGRAPDCRLAALLAGPEETVDGS